MAQLALAWCCGCRTSLRRSWSEPPQQVHDNARPPASSRRDARGCRYGAGRHRRPLTTPPSPQATVQEALTAEMSSRILTLSLTTTLPEPSAALNFMSYLIG